MTEVPDSSPAPASELTIREYRPGDEVAILATFNRVFAAVDPGFVPRTLEEWRWTYLENPSGWRISLALTPDGHVVSQYAGVGQRMLVEGEPANFSQAVDSMTDPAWRRGLKKPGFFVLTGYPYAERYGGPPPDHDTIMWGLPVPPAWRIGKTYLDYELVRTQLVLRAEPEALALPPAPGVEVQEVEAFPEEVEDLFRRAAPRFGAVAIRDRAQLAWRFERRPGVRYRIALARRGGLLVGYTVQRAGSFDGVAGALVCDWLVGPGAAAGEPFDLAAGAALLAWHRERALDEAQDQLIALFPDTTAEWLALQEVGFRAHDTRYFLVGRNYVKRYDMQWLRRHWYYSLGDTDLC